MENNQTVQTATNSENIVVEMPEARPCNSCKGTKVARWDATKPCPTCDGRGDFPKVELASILERIFAKQGKNKGKLRASMTSPWGEDATVEASRAYYVWRLARFDGGIDVRMPVMAGLACHGDPFQKELDLIASAIAKRAFGSDMAGALVWAKAMGY